MIVSLMTATYAMPFSAIWCLNMQWILDPFALRQNFIFYSKNKGDRPARWFLWWDAYWNLHFIPLLMIIFIKWNTFITDIISSIKWLLTSWLFHVKLLLKLNFLLFLVHLLASSLIIATTKNVNLTMREWHLIMTNIEMGQIDSFCITIFLIKLDGSKEKIFMFIKHLKRLEKGDLGEIFKGDW